MIVEWVRNTEALEPLAARWRALAEGRSNGFLTPEWFSAALEPSARKPCVPVVRDRGGQLVGLLPLTLERRQRLSVLAFAGGGLGDVFHAVSSRDREEDVLTAVARDLARRRGWAALALARVEGECWARAFEVAGLRVGHDRLDELPSIEFDGRTWDDYLAERSGSLRRELGQKRRRLERDHAVRFRRTATQEELTHDLATFLSLHGARRKARGERSALIGDGRAVIEQFARDALARGWLRLWILETRDAPVAAWLGWRVGSRMAAYSSGWDPAWARYSVGTLIRANAMRAAAEEGCDWFDLLLGGEDYKHRYATGVRRVETLVVTPARHPARLLVGAELGLRKAGRRLPEGAKRRAHAIVHGLVGFSSIAR